MPVITTADLVELLLEIRGARILTFTATTNARARKNPFGAIVKTETVNGQVNFHFDKAVARQLDREGKPADRFEPGNSWHVPYLVGGRLTPLAMKKGGSVPAYLRFRFLNTVGEVEYASAAGERLPAAAVREFLPTRSRNANQGLDKPVRFLTYALGSIVGVRLDGEHFTIP